MKKLVYVLPLVLLLVFFASKYVQAADYEIPGETLYNDTANAVVSGNLSLNPIALLNRFIKSLLLEITNSKNMIKAILIISVASGTVKILSDSFEGSESANAASLACFFTASLYIAKLFSETVGYTLDTVNTLCDFITKFEPIFISFLVTSGAITQGTVFQPVLSASVYIITALMDNCLMPLICFSAVLSIVNNLCPRVKIGMMTKLITAASKWIMIGILTLFSGILSLYGFGASAFNNVAAKGIKFAVGSFVPVVGGILNDTIDTALTGAGLLKTAVGTAGMAAVVGITLIPIVKVMVMMLLLRLMSAITEPFSDERISRLLLCVSDSIGSAFSVLVTTALLYIISIGLILSFSGVKL